MVEKSVRELEEGKITEDEKKDIEEKIKAIRTAVNEKRVEEAESGVSELEKIWNPIAERLYKDANANREQSGGTRTNPFGDFGFSPGENPFTKK